MLVPICEQSVYVYTDPYTRTRIRVRVLVPIRVHVELKIRIRVLVDNIFEERTRRVKNPYTAIRVLVDTHVMLFLWSRMQADGPRRRLQWLAKNE
jgi:hypothetical protein